MFSQRWSVRSGCPAVVTASDTHQCRASARSCTASAHRSSPQLANPVKEFIPVARISDLLLKPGEEYDYDGKRLTYPDIRLVHWAGGNPFHHHQDLGRLQLALGRPDTVIVNEPYWTTMARHADVVLPSTVSLERDDVGATSSDNIIVAMKQAVPVNSDARHDYDIYAAIAERMGKGETFTEGRSADEWVRTIYESWRERVVRRWPEVPPYDAMREDGFVEIPMPDKAPVMLETFRNDPTGRPLATPSGKIEIYSADIASFGYEDCGGHPMWFEPDEWLGSDLTGTYPLQLIANNPFYPAAQSAGYRCGISGVQNPGPRADAHAPDRRGEARN